MNVDRLLQIRNAIPEGFYTGLIHESYAFVGGRSVWISEAENEAVVRHLLRSIGVKNSEVTAIIRIPDLIDAYPKYHMNAFAATLDRATA
jgi:hypothetical protein